ncbi:MAG: LamG-like jellyroll fold domain-containing protein, partial [Verrucomicrobiota bacterium]
IVSRSDNIVQNSFILHAIPDNAANRFLIHLPWSDGRFYWDFGNLTGPGRISGVFNGGAGFNIWNMVSELGVGQEVYMNGVLQASDATADTFDYTGRSLRVANNFLGEIAEVIIFNRALSDGEAEQVGFYLHEKYGLPSNYRNNAFPAYTYNGSTWNEDFTGVWHFHQTNQSGRLPDATAYEHDGTPAGATEISGQIGNGRDFDGGHHVRVANTAVNGLSNEVTISFWQYGNDLTQPINDTIFHAQGGGVRKLNAHLPWGNGIVYWDAGADATYDRIQRLATPDQYEGQWNHWTLAKNAAVGEMRIYHNGTLFQNGAGQTRTLENINTDFFIGSGNGGGAGYVGAMDEVRLSTVERSSNWVWATYLSTASNLVFNCMDPAMPVIAIDTDGDGV